MKNTYFKPVVFGFMLAFILASCGKPAEDGYYLPAEWETQEAVWMAMFGQPVIDQVTARVMAVLQRQVKVKLVYANETLLQRQKPFLSGFGVDTSALEYVRDSMDRLFFMRDPGPLFLVNGEGRKKIADFRWNRLGNIYIDRSVPLAESDFIVDRIDQRVARRMNLDVVRSDLVAEGGMIEVNGQGTILSIAETALQRNPGRSLEEIEREYLRMLGGTKMIWLKRSTLHDWNSMGPAVGSFFTSGGNGHIDEMARFVNPTTVVLARIDEEEKDLNALNRADYDILEESYRILSQATDQDEQPLRVVRLPTPDAALFSRRLVLTDTLRQQIPFDVSAFQNGDTIYFTRSTSYLNFFISNDVVLLPRYWEEGLPEKEKRKDEEARAVMESLFPHRQVIQINPLQVNRAGGGMHCMIQPEPKSKI